MTSKHFCIVHGVRQGGVLSPQLFPIYVDDLFIYFIYIYTTFVWRYISMHSTGGGGNVGG